MLKKLTLLASLTTSVLAFGINTERTIDIRHDFTILKPIQLTVRRNVSYGNVYINTSERIHLTKGNPSMGVVKVEASKNTVLSVTHDPVEEKDVYRITPSIGWIRGDNMNGDIEKIGSSFETGNDEINHIAIGGKLEAYSNANATPRSIYIPLTVKYK